MNPAGTISGGWEYVWAAYAITWASLTLYAVSLVWRERQSRNRPPTAKGSST